MPERMIGLPGVIAKRDDADFLREPVRDAAQRLTDIEVAAACEILGGWQRCRVPFRRNRLARESKTHRRAVSAVVKSSFAETERDQVQAVNGA